MKTKSNNKLLYVSNLSWEHKDFNHVIKLIKKYGYNGIDIAPLQVTNTWKKIEKNLNFLKNNQVDNVKIAIDNLVNIFNFEFLPEIEEYFWNTKRVGYSCEIKPATSLMNYQNLPEHIINKVKNRLRNDDLRNTLVSGNNNYSKEQLRHEFIVLLAQRKMKAEDVIGPLTREYLEL